MVCKTFGWSLAVTILALVVAFLYGGPEALIPSIILGILEVSLSFVDASFSFDGVIGAFALTSGPIIIGATSGPRRRAGQIPAAGRFKQLDQHTPRFTTTTKRSE